MCDPLEAVLTKKEEIYSPPPQQLASYWFLKIGTISLKNNVEESEPTQDTCSGSCFCFGVCEITFTDRKAQDVEKRHTQVPRQASRDRFGS